MNKKGSMKLFLTGAGLLILLGGIIMGGIWYNGVTQKDVNKEAITQATLVGANKTTPGTGIATGGGTTINTGSSTITYAGFSKLQPGTIVGVGSATDYTRITKADGTLKADYTTSVTSADLGDTIDSLVVNSTGAYHSELVKGIKVLDFTPKVEARKMCKNATLAITMFNADTNLLLADGLTDSDANQSIASGESKTMGIWITGTEYGCQLYGSRIYLQTNSSDTIEKMSLDIPGGVFVGTDKPVSIAALGGNEQVWVYDIPSIDGSSQLKGTLTIKSRSAKDASTMAWKVSGNTREVIYDSETRKVLEPTEKGISGVEDSLGTRVTLNTFVHGTNRLQ